MEKKKNTMWFIIDVACISLLLGAIGYQENKEIQQNKMEQSSIPVPTKQAENITPAVTPNIEENENTEQENIVQNENKDKIGTEDITQIEQENTDSKIPILVNEDYLSYDNTKYTWWIYRKPNHELSKGGEIFDISSYEAYYLNPSVEKGDKVLYLTFDCAYETGFTPEILDILQKENVRAIFFVTKSFLKDYSAYVKRMKEEGHLVGIRTKHDEDIFVLTPEEVQKELAMMSETMLQLTGYEMDTYFRTYLGEYSERLLKVVNDLGYQTFFWSIVYRDFDVDNQPGTVFVKEHFQTYHHNGAIALMHNISESSANALEDVIALLREEGYRFGSLNEFERR